ncbi:hypothetical protein HTSR_0191 [Halodesulfurarchaeum formicicum]|uniref:Uncharacterized protein n=1 Tax=Halodesulfurarchaeum formicicum TaxID=1873524 RepID=A0A1D8S210_9EURY|nr:hypothetical protein HTSR_0191 [Halodesulfurarchaeum formicicum]APE94662.1 hypothetical protein HSR6_0189 [Halodesulfurarchaeum formicicum]
MCVVVVPILSLRSRRAERLLSNHLDVLSGPSPHRLLKFFRVAPGDPVAGGHSS